MNATALMLLLGLMGTVWSKPTCDTGCSSDCKPAGKYHTPDFKQVPELETSSVAPWSWLEDVEANRDPQNIDYAHCKNCIVENMIAKPIIVQVSVFKKLCNDTWCRCPYNLAVGCTCVKQQ